MSKASKASKAIKIPDSMHHYMEELRGNATEFAGEQGQLIQAVDAGTPISLEDLVLLRAFGKQMDQAFGITDDRKGALKWMNNQCLLQMTREDMDYRFFTVAGRHYKLSKGESVREWISEEKLLAHGVKPSVIAASKETKESPFTTLREVKQPY